MSPERRRELARPTPRGWLTIGGAALLIGTARLLGLPDLFLAGTACLVLLACALAYAQLVPVSLGAERRLLPGRVHLHRQSRVELTLTNGGRLGSPALAARDHFARDHSDGGRRATSFLIGPLRPSERATARYRLTAERRGVFEVGPLELELRDPFGLAERRVIAAARNRLVVFPRVEPLLLGSGQGDDDLRVDPPGASLLGRHGDDLYSLRPYAVGDDLRRVHWPSTAHRDELMIRQDHRPGQGGLTVLLDLRRQVHTGASAERAISVAASVAVAASRAGQSLRLVTTEGRTNGAPSGRGEHDREHRPAQLPQLLERLAAAGSSSSGLAEAVALVAASRSGRRQLVAITASDAAPGDLRALHRLGRQFGEAVVVLVETGGAGTAAAGMGRAGMGREGMGGADAAGAPGRRAAAPGGFPRVRVVTVGAGQPLAIAWAAGTGLTSAPGRATRRRGSAPAGRT